MNRISKVLVTAALGLAFLATPPKAAEFEGVVIVPAAVSAVADVDATSAYPAIKRGKIISYTTNKKPGDVIVSAKTNTLYLVLGQGLAVKYRVATAKKGFEWNGTHKVSRKSIWPDWRPPTAMRLRKPELPVFMAGGPKNPLGARAMYLGSTIYRIHGTNEPTSIGKSASSGCIRMLNDDVAELYTLVKIGAEVTVK
jgi:lipoprotein-anchoring transpeptidase ErfK/SrfK